MICLVTEDPEVGKNKIDEGMEEKMLITHRAVSATNRESSLTCLEPLAESKVGQFYVELFIQQNVFTFQVTVNDAGVVKKV